MLLGASASLSDLTGDESYLVLGARTLDAVINRMTMSDTPDDYILTEPFDLRVTDTHCDAQHDPSASGGGDLFSFKGVFMQEMPRFLAAAKHVMKPQQIEKATKLVADSADAAWQHRATPPFPESDVCNEFTSPPLPEDAPPKFTWDWRPLPGHPLLTCMDSRTQSQALSLFVAALRIEHLRVVT